ncbi:MAG TPA: VanZ family protein [Chitinophagaceae bacterium]|nr:VanZ family protein [Chitinophagaceae bacterium]
MRKTYFPLIAAIGWFIISIILLTLPGSAFPKENWFDKIWLDKWIHIGMFAIMVWLWCMSLVSLGPNKSLQKLKQHFIATAILCLGYGIAMEFIQKSFVSFRSFDAGDIVADAVGCIVGLIFSTRRYIKK